MHAENKSMIIDHMNLMAKEMELIFMKWSNQCDSIENILMNNDEKKHSKEIDIQTDECETRSTASSEYVSTRSIETQTMNNNSCNCGIGFIPVT